MSISILLAERKPAFFGNKRVKNCGVKMTQAEAEGNGRCRLLDINTEVSLFQQIQTIRESHIMQGVKRDM